MKRYFLCLFFLLLASPAFTQWQEARTTQGVAGAIVVGSPACSTPATGDELNEGFLGAGYENTWTETIGSGGTVNEDATLTGTPPTGSCTEGLNIIDSAAISRTRWNRGSTIDTSEVNFDVGLSFRINSITLDNYSYAALLTWSNGTDPSTNVVYWLEFRNNNGTYQIRINSTTDSTVKNISLETWYEVLIHSDATPENSYIQYTPGTDCDVAGECAFTTTEGTDGQYLHLGNLGSMGAGEAIDIEFGYVYMSTP